MNSSQLARSLSLHHTSHFLLLLLAFSWVALQYLLACLGFFQKGIGRFSYFFLGLIRFRWRFYETTYLHRLRPAKDLLFST
jgi:hypothetical protein